MDHPQLGYFDDPACLDFEANVQRAFTLPDGRPAVILERSYFYPTGGGQDYDTGTLGGARVVDVIKDGQPVQVIHVLDRALAEGPASAHIDADRRLRHRQHHTAQHLLTQCFIRLLGLDTQSAHISGETPSTIDLPYQELGAADLERVEELANRQIYANLAVTSRWISPGELERHPTRRAPKAQDEIRLVEIEGWDVTPCGGTHCEHTGEIGVLKIVKTERQNEHLRVHFVAGLQAYETFRSAQQTLGALAGMLSVHPRELPTQVGRMADQLRQAEKDLSALRSEMLGVEAQRLAAGAEMLAGGMVSITVYEGRSPAELRSLAGRLLEQPGLTAVLVNRGAGKLTVLAACAPGSRFDARVLLNHLLAPYHGRGGGDATLAQGGCPAPAVGIDELVNLIKTGVASLNAA